jgi:hypothetical protein
VLPQNLRLLWAAHGTPLSLLALAGVAVAALRRSPLAVVALAYGPLALLFYSCWARPEVRYLFGVALLAPLLVVEGALGSLELLGRPTASDRRVRGRLAAACVAAAAAGLGALALARGGPAAALSPAPLVAAALAAGALAAAADPARRPARVVAPVLGVALAALAAALVWPSLAFRAPFRVEDMRRARATIAAHLPPGAVVISSEDIGRPAENVGYWTAAHALYLTDLTRWHLSVPAAARLLLDAGMTPYLLLPAGGPDLERLLFEELRDFPARLVADVPAGRAADWFVVSHYHRGVPLRVYRIGPPPGARAAG